MEHSVRQRQARTVRAWAKKFPLEGSIRKELFMVLAAALAVAFGPDALLATMHTSAILIGILMGLCRNWFLVLRILGM